MAKFRKKPIVIEAVQFDGSWESLVAARKAFPDLVASWDSRHNTLSITTLEGRMSAQADDWIIKGIQSEYYPCKPDIFEETYEAVDG